MNMLQPFTVLTGATLALGLLTPASPAQTVQRLTRIVQRAPATEGQTGAAEAKTCRVAGTTVDADGRPLAGVVVECFRYAGGQWPPGAAYTEVKQRVTTEANGAFEFKVVNCSDKIESERKAFAPVSVPFTQDPKNLQLANDVLDQNTFMRKLSITFLLLFRQLMKL